MKKLFKSIIAGVTAMGMLCTSIGYAAFGLPDGGTDDAASNELHLIDFNSSGAVSQSGFIPSELHKLNGKYSALWDHSASGYVDIKNIPSDWSEYYEIDLSIYAKLDSNDSNKFALVTTSNDGYFWTTITLKEGQNDYKINFSNMAANKGAKWNSMGYIRFSATGWGMTQSKNSEIYINEFKLVKLGSDVEKKYGTDPVKTVYDAMEGNIAVYGGGRQVLAGEEVSSYKNIDYVNKTTYVPVDLFKDYLGASVSGSGTSATVSANGKHLTLTADTAKYTADGKEGTLTNAPYTAEDGTLYVPGDEAARLLGFETKVEKKLLVIGGSNLHGLDSNKKVNVLTEITGYLAYYENLEADDVPAEDFETAKDRWRYGLVGDESLNLEDESIATLISQVNKKGQQSWDKLDTSASSGSLFLGRAAVESADMHTEYAHVVNMAKAWAQYGADLYHDDALLDDILFCLDWMYENRYGQDEIENNANAWRDNTLYNWYEWQIAVPQDLIIILMLVEDYVTVDQIEKYLSFFDYYVHDRCYSSMHKDTGMNVLYTVAAWMGMSLLTNDVEDLVDGLGCLDNVFAWAETLEGTEGFYGDGSCLFHYYHAMNASYGSGVYSSVGQILNVISGLSFDLKTPRRENVFEWTFNSYEPLIYNGGIFRHTQGRSPGSDHSGGMSFVKGMLDLLDFADEETAARMKSIIKYYVQTDTVMTYVGNSNFSVPQMQTLMDIINDDNVKPREDYYISRVYGNMDKTVHQRKTWAFAVSMASTRTYDYECINGENLTGWYTGDGMTQLMVENDQAQFHNGNWWKQVDPYKYPGTTVDTQERDAQVINTGYAFKKEFDFVGGATIDDEYSVAAQKLNAWNLDSDKEQRGNYTTPIKAHHSTLVAQKSWFMFDDEVVCLGGGINANDGFDVRTIVENRRSNAVESLIPEEEVTKQLTVVGVSASAEPQPENPASAAIDGNFATKWADEGVVGAKNSYITFDLGTVQPVGSAVFAFLNGNKRTQAISIDISEDGNTWTEVFNGSSGGKTEGYELFDLGNRNMRYVRLYNYGNSDGGAWISLSEAGFYGPYSGAEATIVEPVYAGSEKITVNGQQVKPTAEETTRDDVNWLSYEGLGGYWFPQGGSVSMRRTEGTTSFFELWMNHGVSPQNEKYAYVILPTMTAEQTKAYTENPGVEILNNDEKVSAVHDKSTGITGIVFWEAGTFDGFTVEEPMVLMYKESDAGMTLVVSDPTHKLGKQTIKTNRTLSAIDADYRVQLSDGGKTITVDFNDSEGGSISSLLKKGK